MTDHTPSVAPDGDPAPVGPISNSGALLRSLAETVTVDGTDQLATREKAVPWLRAAGLLPDDAVLSGSEHGALLRLRDALRDTMAVRASFQPDPDAVARLTRALADGRLVVTVQPDGKSALASSARAPYSNAVAAIAIAVANAWLPARLGNRGPGPRAGMSAPRSCFYAWVCERA
ncbi:MAG TPA: ABATE domain-containing protein [Trebonia sp.]|nr:ABATE domain-containing protein [Trebonia sp.]